MKLHLPKILLSAVVAVCCVQQARAEDAQTPDMPQITIQDASDYSVYDGYAYTIVNWQGGSTGTVTGDPANKAYGICYAGTDNTGYRKATYDATTKAFDIAGATDDTINGWNKSITGDYRTLLFNDFSPSEPDGENAGRIFYDIETVQLSGIIVTATSSVNQLKANSNTKRSMKIGNADSGNTGYSTIAKDFTLDLNSNSLTLGGTQVWNITNGATYTIKNTGSFTNTGTLTVNGTLKINETIKNSGTIDFTNGNLEIGSLNGFDRYLSTGWDAKISESGKTTTSFDYEIIKGGTITNLNTVKLDGQEALCSAVNGVVSMQYDAYGVASDASMDAAFRGAVNEAQTTYLAIKNGVTLSYAQSETAFTSSQILVGEGKLYIGNASDFRSTTASGSNANILLGNYKLSLDSEFWTGTVILDGAKHGSNNARLNLSLDVLSNAKSTVEVKGNTMGYFTGNMLGTLQLTKTKDSSGTEIAALTINNGGSKGDTATDVNPLTYTMGTFSGAVKGEGMLKFSWGGADNANTGYAFSGDISEWKGSFVYDGTSDSARKFNLNLTGSATEVNATISRTGEYGKLRLNVSSTGDVTFNKDVKVDTVNATTGVKLAGNMTTGSFTLGDGATLTLAGGSLNVTGALTLSNVTVDLSKYTAGTEAELVKAGEYGENSNFDWTLANADAVGNYAASLDCREDNSVWLTWKDTTTTVSSITTSVSDEGNWYTLSTDGTTTTLTLTVDGSLAGLAADGSVMVDLLTDEQLSAIMSDEYYKPYVLLELTDSDENTVAADAFNKVVFVKGKTGQNYWGEMVGGQLMYNVERIPEPTTATLSLLALMGLAARRRRK